MAAVLAWHVCSLACCHALIWQCHTMAAAMQGDVFIMANHPSAGACTPATPSRCRLCTEHCRAEYHHADCPLSLPAPCPYWSPTAGCRSQSPAGGMPQPLLSGQTYHHRQSPSHWEPSRLAAGPEMVPLTSLRLVGAAECLQPGKWSHATPSIMQHATGGPASKPLTSD